MKVIELNIKQWQDLFDRFSTEKKPKGHPAMRIENTPFTTARYYGGMTYDGAHYTYFEPVDADKPTNPDGSPYVAWLMVRDDFLRYAAQEAKKIAKEKSQTDKATQGELAI